MYKSFDFKEDVLKESVKIGATVSDVVNPETLKKFSELVKSRRLSLGKRDSQGRIRSRGGECVKEAERRVDESA